MKNYSYLFSVLITLFLFVGCSTNRTKIGEGAGVGRLLGAAAGGIIGNQSGNAGEGALIGGAIGATGGAVAGSQIRKP